MSYVRGFALHTFRGQCYLQGFPAQRGCVHVISIMFCTANGSIFRKLEKKNYCTQWWQLGTTFLIPRNMGDLLLSYNSTNFFFLSTIVQIYWFMDRVNAAKSWKNETPRRQCSRDMRLVCFHVCCLSWIGVYEWMFLASVLAHLSRSWCLPNACWTGAV